MPKLSARWSPKKALITGIFGQDGSYLCEFLSDKGYKVYGIEKKPLSENARKIKRYLSSKGYKPVAIDCDLYSSTKTVLEFLMPRLKHGMIIAFDDYFCWSATQISGERKAMMELFSKDCRWEMVPYMQFGWHGNSFVIEDKKISSS